MDISTELANFLGEKRLLVDAITREFRAGTSARQLAAAVGPAFSRDQVTQYLATVTLHDTAREALNEAGLTNSVVHLHLTGIEAPRQAMLTLVAEPDVTPEYDQLPGRIRAALAPFQICLDLPPGEHESTDNLIDDRLQDGEAVLLARMKPRARARNLPPL